MNPTDHCNPLLSTDYDQKVRLTRRAKARFGKSFAALHFLILFVRGKRESLVWFRFYCEVYFQSEQTCATVFRRGKEQKDRKFGILGITQNNVIGGPVQQSEITESNVKRR